MKKKLIQVLLGLTCSQLVIAQNVGIGITIPVARLHVADSNVLFTGPSSFPPVSSPFYPPAQGAGTRMFWYPAIGAFRAGFVDGVQWDKNNIGQLSFAAGYDTKAAGQFSVAFGVLTSASGLSSTASGFGTNASGWHSVALGDNTTAKAYGAFSAGVYNENTDNPDPSNPVATDRIFQIGNGNISIPARANAITVLRNGNTGIGTLTPAARLHVDSSVVFTGSDPLPPIAANTPISGPGTRMMWYADKAAFRTGTASGTEWDKINIGNNSFASGHSTTASGDYSFASGHSSTASGNYSTAMGFSNNATGNFSTAIGSESAATDFFCTAIGYLSAATAQYSTAIGFGATASDYYATAFGSGTTASGNTSLAMGNQTIASGPYSTTMGYETAASSTASMATGIQTVASGYNSTATGYQSHATGDYSTATGFSTVAKAYGSFVAGIYNDDIDFPDAATPASTDRVFQVGIGTNSLHKNAITVLRNGNIGIGTIIPGFPLNFPNTLGDKISLYGDIGAHYGFGIQGSLLQIHSAAAGDNIALGYGSSSSFTERARIINSGEFGMSVTGRLQMKTGTQSAGIWFTNTANSSNNALVGMFTDNDIGFWGSTGTPGWRFYVNTTFGNAWLQGSLTQNSDARLKKNIQPLSNVLSSLSEVNGYTYNWKDENADPSQQVGLIAQEVQNIYPQLVKEINGKLSVNYNGMIPVLLEAIKEQQKQIEELKKENQEIIKITKDLLQKTK